MEKLRKRMASARKQAGLSQQELARRLGLTVGAVGRWEAGFAVPELKRLQRIAQLLHVSADWLLTGQEVGANVAPVPANGNIESLAKIPLLGTVAAGSGALIDPGRSEELVRVPPSIVGADFALRVKGESMQPLIAEGDTVFCRSSELHLPPFETEDPVQVPLEKVRPYEGKVCVVSINGEGFIKRLEIDKRPKGLYLANFSSLNTAHTGRSVDRQDDCRIQGVAVGLWREL